MVARIVMSPMPPHTAATDPKPRMLGGCDGILDEGLWGSLMKSFSIEDSI
jgi:hypothetical protein